MEKILKQLERVLLSVFNVRYKKALVEAFITSDALKSVMLKTCLCQASEFVYTEHSIRLEAPR